MNNSQMPNFNEVPFDVAVQHLTETLQYILNRLDALENQDAPQPPSSN